MVTREVSRREVEELGEQLRRYRLYLGIAIAALGLVTIASAGLLTFFLVRLDARLLESEERFDRVFEESTATMEALSQAVTRQQQELDAIRKAANDDLEAMREAHRKLSEIRDPRRELGALREANEALWNELANQRAELLKKLQERQPPSASPGPARFGRFQLGTTRLVGEDTDAPKGFLPSDKPVHRATLGPAVPGEIVIELTPPHLVVGEPYELSIRMVNESNAPLEPDALRLDWAFGPQKTGGDVELAASRVAPRSAVVLYAVRDRWTSVHARGPASVTATVTLAGGTRLANTLRW